MIAARGKENPGGTNETTIKALASRVNGQGQGQDTRMRFGRRSQGRRGQPQPIAMHPTSLVIPCLGVLEAGNSHVVSLPLPVYVLGTFVKLIELAQSAETLVAAKAELTSAKRVAVRRSREMMVEWRDMMGARRQ